MTPVDELVRARIAREGPVAFEDVVEAALYHPEHGFYSAGGQAGRRGDFLTSPEVGPLFGAVVARALDTWWHDAGEPAVFVVVEAGAGPGTLACAVLAAEPACARALRYVLVERSARQRGAQAARLALEDATSAFASIAEPDDDHLAATLPPGPIAVSLPELPRLQAPCVVIANELLDNLPFGLLERTEGGWSEVHVGTGDDGSSLVEVLLPTQADDLERLVPAAAIGSRVPRQRAASRWLRDALDLAGAGGRVVALDYGATTAELCARPASEWVRTYRGHARGGAPLHALGAQDITCEVALDQLPPPTSDRSQQQWLRAHGIERLVEEGRRTWSERAHVGDLAAVRARSRVGEAEALLDPTGLGAFRVLEWER